MARRADRSQAAQAYHVMDAASAISEYQHRLKDYRWHLVRLSDGAVLRCGPTRESVARYLCAGRTVVQVA
jgi:hypothetical protein